MIREAVDDRAAPPRQRDISTKEMDDALRSCMGEKRSFVLVLPERDAAGALSGSAKVILGKTASIEAVQILLGTAAGQFAAVVGAYEDALRGAAARAAPGEGEEAKRDG